LAEPVGEVVVVGDAGDKTFFDFKEGTDTEVIGLAGGGWESFVGIEVGASDIELGSGAGAVGRGHDDEVFDLFGIAAVHSFEEETKSFDAGLGTALVDVMNDIGMEESEESRAIAAIEGLVVEGDEFLGVGGGAGGGHEV
jgi:hypothetical protein